MRDRRLRGGRPGAGARQGLTVILRRIVERLKRQEWTTVAIELVLVVVGVFIGIQVSNWNEARKEHALEAVYLDRIAADIRSDIVEMDEIIRVSTVRMSVLNRLLREATGRELPAGFDSARGRVEIEKVPDFSDDDPNSPGFALFILTTLDGNRSAYDTVINTGGIGVMRDAATLRKIQDYYSSVDKVLHFEVALEQNRDKLVDSERKVGISPADELTIGELASRYSQNGELRATAQNYWLYTNRHLKLMGDLRRHATRLADEIQGRPAQ